MAYAIDAWNDDGPTRGSAPTSLNFKKRFAIPHLGITLYAQRKRVLPNCKIPATPALIIILLQQSIVPSFAFCAEY